MCRRWSPRSSDVHDPPAPDDDFDARAAARCAHRLRTGPLEQLATLIEAGDTRRRHHGSGPSSFEKVPVGPFASRSASRTGSRAASWTVRVPSKLLRSVAVKPGHAALTLMPSDSRSEAKATVIALRAVFDDE